MKNKISVFTECAAYGFFLEISRIPRGSGNEKGIADYLENFARERSLYCKRDGLNNVFIRKNAAAGLEGVPGFLLQAHTDMVCEKAEGVTHDFTADGIKVLCDGEFIYADGTTLGADDGAGVAVMLALLDDDTLCAPEIECLFTASEETGMDGAFGFDYSEVHSSRVINLDSEEELNACIGCAGGIHAEGRVPTKTVRAEGKICRIELCGLAGGHSGTDIDLGRKSAVSLMALILDKIYEIYPLHILSFVGGGRDNVIPHSASVTVAFADNTEAKKAKSAVGALKKELLSVLTREDRRGFSLKFTSLGNTKAEEENTVSSEELSEILKSGMLSLKSTSALISALMLTPQGVTDRYIVKNSAAGAMKKNNGEAGAPSASVNLGTVKTEGGCVTFNYLIRSGNPFHSEITLSEIKRLMHICGGTVDVKGRYPGWESREGEPLQALYTEAALSLYGKAPIFSRVHAGLECGIIYEKLKACGTVPEIISIGPNTYGIHTPREELEAASFIGLYETVKYMLENGK